MGPVSVHKDSSPTVERRIRQSWYVVAEGVLVPVASELVKEVSKLGRETASWPAFRVSFV